MKEENFGPVSNPDGSPTELTKQMLEGTGRDPVEFAARGMLPLSTINQALVDGGIISKEEKEDLTEAVSLVLGDYEDDYIHGQVETGMDDDDQKKFNRFYESLGKIYFLFTGNDYFGGHGYFTNYTHRQEEGNE